MATMTSQKHSFSKMRTRSSAVAKEPYDASYPYSFNTKAQSFIISCFGGATENAGLENAGPSKMKGWKTRDWKTRDRLKGGGKRGTKMQGWKTQDWKTRDHHSGGGKRDQ